MIGAVVWLGLLGGTTSIARAGGRGRDARPHAGRSAQAVRLERLKRTGDFDRFVRQAIDAAQRQPDDPAIQLLAAEALLSTGRLDEAERCALRLARQLVEAERAPENRANRALPVIKLWLAARLRQGRPLADPAMDELLARLDGMPGLGAISFWRQALGDDRPYRAAAAGSATNTNVELKQSTAWSGLVSRRMEGIEAEFNGARMPLVFIDTGAQHTILSTLAAAAAGVEMGPVEAEMTGFATFAVRPGVVRRLRIGSLVLRDVPVYVGDSPALVSAKGQAALGIDLMHHVRFTIDYPRRRVLAEPAARASRFLPASFTKQRGAASDWQIPLWTFSQTCLAQGRLADGRYARALVDTGNRSGTFVSARWARRSAGRLRAERAGLFARFQRRKFELPDWQLGGHPLGEWPVADVLPAELERKDAFDILVGHDLLAAYRVSIDLPGRQLRLSAD